MEAFRQWLNRPRNSFLVVVSIVVIVVASSVYYGRQRSDAAAAAVAKAVEVARNVIEPKLQEFEAAKRRLPRGNFELELPSRTAKSWEPLTVVDLLPDGRVYFEFTDPGASRSEGAPAFVWRLRDGPEGKANSCGAQRVVLAALLRNGLDCDQKVPTMEPEMFMAFARAAEAADNPQAARAARDRLKVKRKKVPADYVIDAIGRDSDRMLAKLKAEGVDICLPDPQGRLPLAEAARNNQIKALTALALGGCDLQQVEPFSQQTALTSALSLRSIDATTTLLAAGADPNFASPAVGVPPLFLLGTSGDPVTMHLREALRRRGADLNATDADGYTLLMRAADRGTLVLTRWLITNGANLNLQDGEGRTALMHAVLSTNGTDVAKALVGAKADVSIRDAQGTTALGMTRLLQDAERQKTLDRLLMMAGGEA